MEKQIREIIHEHCGGTYESRVKATEEIIALFSSVTIPTNDQVYDKALNYIKTTGIIDNPTLRDEVFGAYKYGCYWMRRQLK